jgi:hypothetical protein
MSQPGKDKVFKSDSTKADKLTLHAHKEEEFWLWVASWALFVQKPSDLTGNPADDEGITFLLLMFGGMRYPSDHSTAGIRSQWPVSNVPQCSDRNSGCSKRKKR